LAVVFGFAVAEVVGCALSAFFGVMTARVFESSTEGLDGTTTRCPCCVFTFCCCGAALGSFAGKSCGIAPGLCTATVSVSPPEVVHAA
jgi:hypothetical protein